MGEPARKEDPLPEPQEAEPARGDDKAPETTNLRAVGDPPADEFVERLKDKHGVLAIGALLDLLLQWDPTSAFPKPPDGLPIEVVEEAQGFLHARGVLDGAFPEIFWPKIHRAQRLFAKFERSGLIVLGCASLPACYAFPGVASVLMGSGRLSVQVTRRLQDTIAFLTKVMTPGSLDPKGEDKKESGDGTLWIRKVRLVHALMRCLTLADPKNLEEELALDRASHFFLNLDWQSGENAKKDLMPIDQCELAFVLLTFSWLLVRGFRRLYVPMSAKEADDHIYTWSVIGHALGIRESLRPGTAKAAEAMFDGMEATLEQGTEGGRLLAAALVVYIVGRQREAVLEYLPHPRKPWVQSLITLIKPFAEACLESLARTWVRKLAGPRTAKFLWIPRAPFIHWVVGKILRTAMRWLEQIRQRDFRPRIFGGKRSEAGLAARIGYRLRSVQRSGR